MHLFQRIDPPSREILMDSKQLHSYTRGDKATL